MRGYPVVPASYFTTGAMRGDMTLWVDGGWRSILWPNAADRPGVYCLHRHRDEPTAVRCWRRRSDARARLRAEDARAAGF